jgi:hypothetical protein
MKLSLRLKGLLANLCLAVSVCAFLMCLSNWSRGETGNSEWGFGAGILGWVLCMLLRSDIDTEARRGDDA